MKSNRCSLTFIFFRSFSTSFVISMNYLVGDSRVRGFRDIVPRFEFPDVWSRPGGHIRDMLEWVDDLTILHHGEENTKAHFYFAIGICDVTERLRGHNYDEVIFNNQLYQDRKPSIFREINDLILATRNQYAMPIFCTIPPLSLQKWNHHRLATNKTSHLVHINAYSQMQIDLENALTELNNHLTNINIGNGFATPMMHRDIEHNRGKGKKVVNYKTLIDGCHFSNSLLLKCKKTLMVAYTKNRNRQRY